MKTEDPRLDRRIQFDDRSRNYPIRALLGEEKIRKPRSYSWRCDAFLDQGTEGACVGFAWAHELVARPVAIKGITSEFAQNIYKTAKTLDPWEGDDYDGTSVLAGAQAVQKLFPSAIKEYRWAFGIDDVLATVGYFGPVILGTNWYSGMYRPDASGNLSVSGHVVGGHAYLLNGVSISRELARIHNSWGADWGIIGEAYISFRDLERLLKEEGEACVPVIRGKI